jgi:DNA-binding MltR family transcriptional regulator
VKRRKRPPKPSGAPPRPRTKNVAVPPQPAPAPESALVARYLRPFLETFKDGSAPFTNEALSDTELVVTATNIIDQSLRIAIITLFRDSLSATGLAGIFEGDGPLSTFDSKIRVCRGFRLISPDVKQDLDIIRTIRNRFAHTSLPRHFTDSDIEIACKRLRCPGISRDKLTRFAKGEDISEMNYWKEALGEEYGDSPLSPEEMNALVEKFQLEIKTPRQMFIKSCQITLFSLAIDAVFSAKALLLITKNWNDLAREAHVEVLRQYAKKVLGKGTVRNFVRSGAVQLTTPWLV